jgi:folate-dependent phosphoribosylglycinamide formyltransferase PurN
VLPDDTADSLHERIKAVEHRLFPQTILRLAEERSA